MRRFLPAISLSLALAACGSSDTSTQSPANEPAADAKAATPAPPAAPAEVSIVRLHCGGALIKNFDTFFSDRRGLYDTGARPITDSCYLIRHGDQQMLWDTGFAAALKGQSKDMGELVARLERTIPEQLEKLNLKASDIDVVGISHMHADHTGQAADFPQARLIVGKGDFEQTRGKDDPFGPWRQAGAKITTVAADTDIFGDGSVTALHLPGHTADHMALLVKLKSGPVLLTGDLYHSTMAREKRGVPPFNTSREKTLQSMDRFETLAKDTGAKVIIQHEPADVSQLPAFPAAAQ